MELLKLTPRKMKEERWLRRQQKKWKTIGSKMLLQTTSSSDDRMGCGSCDRLLMQQVREMSWASGDGRPRLSEPSVKWKPNKLPSPPCSPHFPQLPRLLQHLKKTFAMRGIPWGQHIICPPS